jgi:hypothetical protein
MSILNIENVRGLSLSRPWPFAFTEVPAESRKLVENRSWSPPRAAIGQFVALHAAKSWDPMGRDFIKHVTGVDVPGDQDLPSGELFAIGRLVDCVTSKAKVAREQRRWFFGPCGWIFEDVVKLVEPVKCSGAQGLWTFQNKPDVLRLLVATYERSIEKFI